MTRSDSSFPVSRSQGIGSWETAAGALIGKELHLPRAQREKRLPGKLKSPAQAVRLGTRHQAPPMAIQRRYEPAAGALDDLVEALYQLLAHSSGDNEQRLIGSVGAGGTDIDASKEAT